MLFLGAPGTGKTMLSKAIATSFNCPFVTIPGSGFAQTFIGMDAVIVRFLARKAKKMAAKWGGQCIVFIDEIDAVGMRRAVARLAASRRSRPARSTTGSSSARRRADLRRRPRRGDRGVARAAVRACARAAPVDLPARSYGKLAGAIRNVMIPGMMGGGMGGGLALNQLLVVMDGIDEPPLHEALHARAASTRSSTRCTSSRSGSARSALRLKPPKPRKEEVYFIGACNVPLEALDPALVRPGRMGRHIYFRTPTWEDRRDIFDLYLGKVAHEEDLDTPSARATSWPASPTATRRR